MTVKWKKFTQLGVESTQLLEANPWLCLACCFPFDCLSCLLWAILIPREAFQVFFADEHRHIIYVSWICIKQNKSMVNNQQPSGQLFENTREECCSWFQRINSPSHKPWEANFSTMTYSKAPTKRLAVATIQVVPLSITLLLSLFLKSACYMRRYCI